MSTRKKVKIQIRKFTIRWPHFDAEASISVAVTEDAPVSEVQPMALNMLRMMIMQESLAEPLPRGEVDG